jgi:TetR/AcrR family transcriptional repressor of uid operon
VPVNTSLRQVQRLETRQRVFDAALAEIQQVGLANADVAAIVAAAGVARGTFYFHFPTKEHVVAEAKERIEAGMADELDAFVAQPRTVREVMEEFVDLTHRIEQRVGEKLFRELLATTFAASGIASGEWGRHRLLTTLTSVLAAARERGDIAHEINPVHSALLFLLGHYALLSAIDGQPAFRTEMLSEYLTNQLRSLGAR